MKNNSKDIIVNIFFLYLILKNINVQGKITEEEDKSRRTKNDDLDM